MDPKALTISGIALALIVAGLGFFAYRHGYFGGVAGGASDGSWTSLESVIREEEPPPAPQVLVPVSAISAAPSASYAERDIAREFIRGIINHATDLQENYTQELEKIGWFNVLDYETLEAKRDYKKRRQVVAQAKALEKKYRKAYFELIDKIPEVVAALDISEDTRSGILGTFTQEESPTAAVNDIWQLEEQGIAETEKIIDLLERRSGKWASDGDLVQFESGRDMDLFEAAYNRLEEIRARQSEMKREQFARLMN